MAVIINLTDDNGSKTQDFKQDNTPATQGNVINTLDAYNEKIKKEYYDKTQARADENALQTSIQNIVKLLSANTAFTNKTIPANTNSEDESSDRLDAYSGNFSEDDNSVKFDVAGLVRKINVIANILSGDTESLKQWGADVHGNNIGAGESTLNVPVIGITRKETNYEATFTDKDNVRNLTISGLNDIKIKRTNGNEDTIEASEITVLSEKQVSEMICCSVKSVLGGFDSQIANIVSYLLFQEGDLPDSYKFVLNRTNDDGIKSAPLYVTYEDNNSNIGGGYTSPAYYIHDLNGDIKESPDYVINKSNINLLRGEGYKPTNSNFTLKADDKLNKISVSYNNESNTTYTLDVPKKTVTLNLHKNPEDGKKVSYTYKLFEVEIGSGCFEFRNGIAFKNFPQGSIVTITMPDGFTDTLFYEEGYKVDGMNKPVVVDLSKNDAHIYNKKLTFNIKDKETNTEIRYYSGDLLLEKKLSYPGYTATNESVFGVGITDNRLLIQNDKIKNEIQANTDEFTFDCDITWENRKVNVTLKYLEGGEQKTDTKNLVTGQEIPSYNVIGYDFKGWQYSNGNPCTVVPFTDEPTLELTAVQTLKKYNCIYDLNGGQWDNGANHQSIHEHVFTNTSIPTSVSRPGYNFVGWYRRPELEDDSYKVDYFQNEDCTYYAKWKEKSYTINFELDSPKQLEDGANPMFKYRSLTVKASNLPITLGQAYATGYDFVGWAKTEGLSSSSIGADNLDSYAKVTSLEISDFTSDNISLSAVWKAKNVPVIEEYYYEIDGQSGKYDLLETSKKEATVGTVYSKDTSYSINTGFVENKASETFKVMPTGNVYKRYFNRNTFTVTYKGIGLKPKLEEYTYSDNAQELKSIKDLTGTDNKLFDCWLKVETDGSKTPIKHISAYHFGNIEVVARYNQDAPVLGIDFTVETGVNEITVKAIGTKGTIYINDGTKTEPEIIANGSSKVFNYNDVYSGDVTTTKSCFVFFEGNDATNQNPSSTVDILLIYNNTPPVKGTDYNLDSSTSTIKKLPDTEGLEYRIGDSNYFELASDQKIERNATIYIRKKATFNRFASADVSESFNEKAAAHEEQLITDNFTVVDVSYKEQGHIEIKNAVFEGNHGALQYKTGSGNAWLDVNRTGSTNDSTTLYVDKPCTVSFRYNESDEYLASSITLNLTVGIKTHTVTFDVSDIPSNNYKFDGLTQIPDTKKLTLLADSGSQLCKVEKYIKNVNNWTVTGYNMDIDTKLGRAVSFLKKKDDGTYYNEASVIDSDITLVMNWKPIQFNNVNYTDAVLLGDTELKLPTELLGEYTKTFSYGKDVEIKLVNDLSSLTEYKLAEILNALDKNTDKLLSLEKVYYKTGNSSYTDTGVEVTTNSTRYSFPYFGEKLDFSKNTDSFPYKFASRFEFIEANDEEEAQIQFINDVGTGKVVGTVESVSYYGGTGFSNFKCVIRSDNILDVYHADDPRAEGYNNIGELNVTENISGGGRTLTVIFHSAYISGTFYPRKDVTEVIAIKSTVTNQDSIYSINVGDNGSTVIDPKEGWTITTTDVSAYQANGN